MTYLRHLVDEGGHHRYGHAPRTARRLAPTRPRARAHRAARVPRLLPDRVGHRPLLPGSRHLLPGPGQRRQLGGLLRPRHHQRRRRRPRPAVRALPVARARRPARHRPRHRVGPAGGGDPVRLRQARSSSRRPGGQRHHLPGQVRDPRHRQGPRLRPRPAGRLVEAGRPVELAALDGHAPRPRHPRPRARARPAGGALPPPPRHPLRRHGALRPAGHRGVPCRVGPDGEPVRPAMGQGRLRRRGPREVRSARPGDALGHPRHRRPGARGPRRRDRPRRPAPGRRHLRHALPGRLRRRLPGGVPGADVHVAPAQAAHASTTWWWRSP